VVGAQIVPLLDIVDETFVVASPTLLRRMWCDEAAWDDRFADLTLRCYEDRGLLGKRWYLTGTLVGSAEVWLEEFADGVLVHVYVRADPAPTFGGAPLKPRQARRARRQLLKRYARPLKRWGFVIKDAAEGPRRAGEPSVSPQPQAVGSAARSATTTREGSDGRSDDR
jgi:hypothetical protein